MARNQTLTVQDKQELQSGNENTVPGRYYVPATDIFETADELVVVMELPGIEKHDVDVKVENQQLSIDARLDLEKYTALRPAYTEYNLGHFTRTFQLSSKIDSDRIDAKIEDGVLTLHLPKVAEAKPRKIKVG